MEKENEISNMEVFLTVVAVCCLVLAIGYKNLILGGVAIISGFFAIGSYIVRRIKEESDDEMDF